MEFMLAEGEVVGATGAVGAIGWAPTSSSGTSSIKVSSLSLFSSSFMTGAAVSALFEFLCVSDRESAVADVPAELLLGPFCLDSEERTCVSFAFLFA
jgi:hypothetical protein